MATAFTESTAEEAALHWFSELGYQVAHGSDLVPEERATYGDGMTVGRVRANTLQPVAAVDWTLREPAQAKLRVMVKRVLRSRGFPPDEQEQATLTVLQQAELFARDWAA